MACKRSKAKCGGKYTYETAQEAFAKALEINAEREWKSVVAGYCCSWCKKFHHSTVSGRKGASNNRRMEKQRRRMLWKS